MFLAWTNNLSDYEDDGYSDVDEEESDEEFNQKTEGNKHKYVLFGNFLLLIGVHHAFPLQVDREEAVEVRLKRKLLLPCWLKFKAT